MCKDLEQFHFSLKPLPCLKRSCWDHCPWLFVPVQQVSPQPHLPLLNTASVNQSTLLFHSNASNHNGMYLECVTNFKFFNIPHLFHRHVCNPLCSSDHHHTPLKYHASEEMLVSKTHHRFFHFYLQHTLFSSFLSRHIFPLKYRCRFTCFISHIVA